MQDALLANEIIMRTVQLGDLSPGGTACRLSASAAQLDGAHPERSSQ